MIMLNDGKTDEAFTTLQKTAKSNPDNPGVKIWLGRAARAKGDMTVAQQSFRDAAKLTRAIWRRRPAWPRWPLKRATSTPSARPPRPPWQPARRPPPPTSGAGMAEGSQHEFDKAEADFNQALKLDPKNSLAYLELAPASPGSEEDPRSPEPDSTGDHEQPQLRPRRPHVGPPPTCIKSSPAKAISAVQDQIAKSPQNNEMYDLLADLQMATGDSAGALVSSQKAMQLKPPMPPPS